MSRSAVPLLTLVVLALVATVAHADEWLTVRHDPQRTGASSGTLAIDRPAVVWRRYLGGQLSGTQYLALDVDGDGTREVIYIAGGRAIAKRPNNIIVWESPLLTLSTILGVSDLDGDGSVDIVASSSSFVFVLSSADGRVLWTNPGGPIGEVGTTHVADLDGDHHPDLYIGECRCCTLRGTSNGVAYGFTGGFAAARLLWTLGAVGGCGADADQIADVNGDGQNELIVSSLDTEIAVVSGATGTVLTRIPAPAGGGFFPGTRVYPVNLDGDAALEMVAITNGYLSVGDRGARRIAVYDWNGTAFVSLWQVTAPDRANDEVSLVDGAIGDLDGDASADIAFTMVTGGVAHVEIRSGVTGAMRAMLRGVRLVAAVDLDNDHLNELLVTDGAMLSAYKLTPAGPSRLWSLAGRNVVGQFDHARWVSDANATTALALDLDADPALELIVSGLDAMGRSTLWALNGDTNPPTELGHFSAPNGITLLTSAVAQHVTQPYSQVITVTSDGYLIVLDRMMQPTNRITEGEIELPGMRIGGYYSGPYGIGSTPSIARLDSQAVLVRDSRPSLLRLDASSASPSTAPRIVWERRGAQWPVVADVDGDGARDVIVAEGADVVNVDPATGSHERWRARGAIGPGGLYGDLLPARRGAGLVDIYLPRALPGSVFQAVAINGATGDVRWSGFTRALSWGYQSYSVGDLTGDGTDDFVSVTNSTHVLTGVDGTLSSDNGTFVAYAMPMQTDANGDGVTDVWVHGGYYADRLISRTMTTTVVRSDRTAPNTGHYGARVTCSGVAAVVESGYNTGDLWTMRLSDATPLAHRTLASGGAYDVGTVPSDHPIGLAGNVTAVGDVGTGHPAVLAGSTDGYLYALDPCTLAAIWSLDLRYPVGESVVGDVNGADPDELLVTCADGFLYGIGRAAYESPNPVLDVDPLAGHPDTDVDTVDTVDTLWARWSPVTGATSYEAGVYSAGGSETRFPNFTSVGNVTSTRIDMLPLRQGQRYYVSVHAIGPNGPGLEGRSNGVTVTDTLPPTALVSVSPNPAWPGAGNPPMILATCADRVGLSHYTIAVQRPDGTVLRSLDDRDYSGQSHEVHVPWDGRDTSGAAQPAGSYTAHVVCRDLHRLESTADATFVLDPSATLPVDAGAPRDAGIDGGRRPTTSPGCSCHSAGNTSSSSARTLGLLGLVVVLATERRRTRSLPHG